MSEIKYTPTMQEAIVAYIKVRNAKEALDRKHKEEMRRYNDALQALEAIIMEKMDAAEVSSMKCSEGTAFTETKTSCTVSDWDTTLSFVQEHELWHLLSRSISAPQVRDYMDETGKPVPGVKLTQARVVRVHRGKS